MQKRSNYLVAPSRPCMLSGHASTARSVALLRATLALVLHSLSKSDLLEWPLRKLDWPCRTMQCFAVASCNFDRCYNVCCGGMVAEAAKAVRCVWHPSVSVMLPTSARVAQEVYEPLKGIQYPMLCSHKNGRWQTGTGSIRESKASLPGCVLCTGCTMTLVRPPVLTSRQGSVLADRGVASSHRRRTRQHPCPDNQKGECPTHPRPRWLDGTGNNNVLAV